MTKYSQLTTEQIRSALDHMEDNYWTAMEAEAFGLAQALRDKIDGLMVELRKRTKQVTAEELITVDIAAMLK